MIRAYNIDISYGSRSILRNIDFEFGNGILVILGVNGVGKSSLLRVICGLQNASNGQVLIDNLSLSSFSKLQLAKKVAFVPQELEIIFDSLVYEILLLGRLPYFKLFGLPSSEDRNKVDEVLEKMNLKYLADRKFSNLSGGEKRLIMIAKALIQDTPYIIMDEPTTFLDIKNSFGFLSRLRKLAIDEGKVFIITLHDINEAIRIADYLLLLKKGGQARFGIKRNLMVPELFEEVFGIKFRFHFENRKTPFIEPME